MAVSATEYETLRAWSAKFLEQIWPLPAGLSADSHPIAVLDAMAQKAPARARQGLGMMIGDLIEDTGRLPASEVKRIDAEFANAGLPTLSEMRLRFMRQVTRILKRGSIRNDEDYYLIRNAVEGLAANEQERLWELLADYESRCAVTK
jgi:hypothetical protein